MNLLLDTNILIYLSRDAGNTLLNEIINPDDKEIFVSVASLGELKSIALQNSWGRNKWQIIDLVLNDCTIVEINENLIETYATIDAYSQRRNRNYSTYAFDTPRNMGKNDLWIASTAALLGLSLLTTDSDFDHLHNIFLIVNRVPANFTKTSD